MDLPGVYMDSRWTRGGVQPSIINQSLVLENLFKEKEDSKFDSDIEPTGSKEFHHRTNQREVDTAENHSPIIHYSFQFVIPLLGVLFLSGYGPILITVDIRYSTDNERGYIRIGIEKNNEFSTPASTPPPTRSPTPPPPNTSQQQLEDLLDVHNQDNDHLQRKSTLFSLPDVPHSDPFLLLELICEALPAKEEETILYLRENPTRTYLTDTPNDLSSAYLGHPTTPQNPFIPLRNLFSIESKLRNERTFTELSRTPTLLSPLAELFTIEEDISCDCATINPLNMLASIRDLFPILREVPSSTASPTPSSLFTIEKLVSPSQDQISKETPIRVINDSFIRPQWSVPRVVEGPPAKRT
ncbi:hypothetical protein PILCRDRAFT_9046 [Piloderma croceum F 1598]|uniref:Uncharacterized protein n=1 Tax=Piloderma croceum (strain F 1598) TaxID=765440 RepID=A0A0C3F8C1_PILCF|nr:hypothetical protein PILCRDRAFT_9046 [Piloderma croceum F 1598]